MRNLLPFLLITLLISCQKEDKDDGNHCYTCHLTGGVPYEHKTIDTCSGAVTSDKYHFEDANGNPMDFLCVEK